MFTDILGKPVKPFNERLVVEWWSSCLVCARIWLPSPTGNIKKEKRKAWALETTFAEIAWNGI